MNPLGSYRGDTADVWPELRRYVLSRGGLASGAWSADLLPGGLYRRRGVAPDVLAVEMPSASECPSALGLWDPDSGGRTYRCVDCGQRWGVDGAQVDLFDGALWDVVVQLELRGESDGAA